MKTPTTCFITLLALLSLTVKAQTAEDIIAKHIDAIGGKDKISQVTSIYIEETVVEGNQIQVTSYVINGKACRTESDFSAFKIIQVVTDKGGWYLETPSTHAIAMSDDIYKRALKLDRLNAIQDPLLNFIAKGSKVILAGQEKVDDVNAYKLQLTDKDLVETDFYIDPSTWYIIKMATATTIMGHPTTATTAFSNFKKTDFGIVMPYTINGDDGLHSSTTNIQKVIANKEFDSTIFQMPKPIPREY